MATSLDSLQAAGRGNELLRRLKLQTGRLTGGQVDDESVESCPAEEPATRGASRDTLNANVVEWGRARARASRSAPYAARLV